MTSEYPASACMDASLPHNKGVCRGCGQPILWGLTTKGKPAPFDVADPHVNHWITCPDAQKRQRYQPSGASAASDG